MLSQRGKKKHASKSKRKLSSVRASDKKLLKQLRQSQNQLNLALTSSHIGIWEWNIKSNKLRWSDNVHSIFGREQGAFDGTFDSYFEMVHPEDIQRVKDSVGLSLSKGIHHYIIYRILWPDSSVHWIEVTGEIKRNKKGTPQKMTGTVRDVTERKNAEDALRKSEDRFRNLIRNLNVGVLLQGPTAEIILSNSKALELLGLSMDQLIGKTSFDPEWRVVHDDGANFPGSEHPVPTAIRTLQPVRNITMGVFRPNTHDLVWLLVNAEPVIGEDDSLKEVVCTFTDITERRNTEQELRESEFRYRTLQEASYGGIAMHDKGIMIDCNQGLSNLTGYTHEELMQLNGLDLVAPEARPEAREKIVSGYEKPYDSIGLRKDGTRYKLEIHGKQIPYKGRQVRVTEFRDITPRKLAEEKIIEQNYKLTSIAADLRRKNEQLEEFTQIVSHNLRSPLSNILTLLEFHEKSDSEGEKTQLLKLLNESALKIKDTLHELNEVLKIKQNKTIESEKLSFEAVLEGAKNLLSAKIMEADAIIHADFAEAPEVLYPNIYLESIFINLLSNAIKYRHPDRRVEITFETHPENGEIILQVSDNGMGIDLSKYGHQIFKLRKTFHKNTESRGIGLFMVKNQIEAMGGEISVASEENIGTTFVVRFLNR